MLYDHYKYTIVLFGLVNSPAAFKGNMNLVLHEYLDQLRIPYLDNIVAYLYLFEEHTEHIQCILTMLQEVGLYLML
jgi:hypothetical protein